MLPGRRRVSPTFIPFHCIYIWVLEEWNFPCDVYALSACMHCAGHFAGHSSLSYQSKTVEYLCDYYMCKMNTPTLKHSTNGIVRALLALKSRHGETDMALKRREEIVRLASASQPRAHYQPTRILLTPNPSSLYHAVTLQTIAAIFLHSIPSRPTCMRRLPLR